jgi:hypothetical protein
MDQAEALYKTRIHRFKWLSIALQPLVEDATTLVMNPLESNWRIRARYESKTAGTGTLRERR